MKMEYRRHLDNGAAPWQLVTNIDELMWNGEYFIRVSNDNGSSKLPFPMSNDETATLVVKDYSHEGKLQRNRKIVQEISKVEQEGGKVLNYTRVYHEIYGTNRWGSWEQETNREGTSSGDNKEENKIQWTSSSYLDTYTTAGIYDITGERTNDADGLPLANAAPGHTFHARLLVLDSSIAGSGKDTDKCITQILSLSNRTGGDGNVYTRTGRAASKNLLAGGSGWGPWGKLQQNVEVGQVTSLDSFTDNGIYSGVYTGDGNNAETFVMIVINNYAVAAETGNIRSISQYKHALNIDGTFSHKTRTGQGNTGISWGCWVDLGAATTTDIQDGAITAQKLSNDAFQYIEDTSFKSVDNVLTKLYLEISEKNKEVGLNIQQDIPDGVLVEWGDGNIQTFSGTGVIRMSHTYADKGRYIVSIADNGGNLVLGGEAEGAAVITVTRNVLKKVKLGSEVTEIRPYTFIYCSDITEVIIPDSVTGIGRSAFNGCRGLKYIILPNSVTNIGYGSFMYSTSMEYIRISNNVTNIGQSAFTGCSNLRRVNLSKKLNKIESSAFSGCSSLAEVRFGDCISEIGANAFGKCGNVQCYDFSKCVSVPVLANIGVFEEIPSDCSIVVPDNLYDDWIVATNWSTYAGHILKASEY